MFILGNIISNSISILILLLMLYYYILILRSISCFVTGHVILCHIGTCKLACLLWLGMACVSQLAESAVYIKLRKVLHGKLGLIWMASAPLMLFARPSAINVKS